MRTSIAIFLVFGLFASHATHAICRPAPEKVIRGLILRCESAAPYLESASSAKPHREIVAITDGGVSWGPPVDLARISEEQAPGTVAVVAVRAELRMPARGRERALPEGHWIPVLEHARYWWKGPPDECTPHERGRMVELWVRTPCCDTLPRMGACLANLDHAEPVPGELRDRLPATDVERED